MNERKIFWNIHNAIILLPFLLAGYVTSKRFKDIRVTGKGLAASCFLLVGGGMIGLFANSQIGYLGCNYGNPILFYLASCSSILGIVYISKLLPNSSLITYLGKNTIHVLLMHKFPIIFFMVLPVIGDYLEYGNKLICVLLSLVITILCYVVGWTVSKNKYAARVLFGR